MKSIGVDKGIYFVKYIINKTKVSMLTIRRRYVYLATATVLIVCYMIIFRLDMHQYSCSTVYQNGFNENSTRRCRYVYLDLGSNKGVQIRKLYEPWLYPKGEILPFYDEIFGEIRHHSRRDVCTFGFEANPRHMKRLKYIEKRYKSYGIDATFFNNAVSNVSSETVTIYSDTTFDIDWGSGIHSSLIDNKSNMTLYKVQTVDIVKFFAESIAPLRPEYVFAKMDIEGSEFIVLPHMLKAGLLCDHAISSMVLEMHDRVREDFQSDMSLATLKDILKEQACTPTSIHDLDDETYIKDVPIGPCECE